MMDKATLKSTRNQLLKVATPDECSDIILRIGGEWLPANQIIDLAQMAVFPDEQAESADVVRYGEWTTLGEIAGGTLFEAPGWGRGIAWEKHNSQFAWRDVTTMGPDRGMQRLNKATKVREIILPESKPTPEPEKSLEERAWELLFVIGNALGGDLYAQMAQLFEEKRQVKRGATP